MINNLIDNHRLNKKCIDFSKVDKILCIGDANCDHSHGRISKTFASSSILSYLRDARKSNFRKFICLHVR